MSELANLIKAARKLDRDALLAVFDLFSPALYKFVSRFVHDPALADRIVADVFAQLVQEFAMGRGPRANLRPYLYQTAYRLVVEHLGDIHMQTALQVVIRIRPTGPSSPTPPQGDEQAGLQKLLSVMNTELSADQRLVILLRFFEDFSVKETAEIVGKDVNNIKVIQSRGLARLTKAMGLEPGEDATGLLRS